MPAYALSEEQSNALDRVLKKLKQDSEALTVLLADGSGNIMGYVGKDEADSVQAVAALVAGSFAATRELAGLVGEKEFHAIFHQGEDTSIFIKSIASTFLLLVVMSKDTTEGLVRLYSERVVKQLLPVLVATQDRSSAPALDLDIDTDADVFS